MATNLGLARAQAEMQGICRAGSKTFYLAAWMMPAERRRATWAVYGFCRTIDDLADEGQLSPVDVTAELNRWRAWLCTEQRPVESPLQLALNHALVTLGLPAEPLLRLIDGVEQDLSLRSIASDAELQRYCYLVAGTVGEMMAHLFTFSDEAALVHARMLGEAMQLTNILRDVGEDFGRGRIYLPASLMRGFGVSPIDLAQCEPSPALIGLLEHLARRAEHLYQEALAGVGYLPLWARPCVRAAAAMYRAILAKIRQGGYQVLTRRAVVPGHERLWLGLTAAIGGGSR